MKILFCTFIIFYLGGISTFPQEIPSEVGLHFVKDKGEEQEQLSTYFVLEKNDISENSILETRVNETPHYSTLTNIEVSRRWWVQDAEAIAWKVAYSGNGQTSAIRWLFNSPRLTFHRNNAGSPIWQFPTGGGSSVAMNYGGDKIACGTGLHVYVFDSTSNVPIFDFTITPASEIAGAGPLALTQSGDFLIATAGYGQDSSRIWGFNVSSTTPVWTKKFAPGGTGSKAVQGIKMSGNDSLIIVNTYNWFYVINTFTGTTIYSARLYADGTTATGSQFPQAINYDGSLIATGNYRGLLRVFQWNPSTSTYDRLWSHQEPPGNFQNWVASIDFSSSGEYLGASFVVFDQAGEPIPSKVKFFNTSLGETPLWTYNNVHYPSSLKISQLGNILAVSSYGPQDNSAPDFYVFKPFNGSTPKLTVSTVGSMYDCALSQAGTDVLIGGKLVWSGTMGMGGIAQNFSVDTTYSNPILNITALIEGFYNSGIMTPDTVTVELRSSTSPYSLVESQKVVLNDLGQASINFYAVLENLAYYIVVKHRNSIETWSKTPRQFTNVSLTYDFTTAATQAYGDNLKLKLGNYCIFSGDVNQDGNVDLSDLIEVDNDNANFVTGYVPSDVNGDNSSDLSDMIIVDNNNAAFVGKVTP